jgi:hypothetical protein
MNNERYRQGERYGKRVYVVCVLCVCVGVGGWVGGGGG